MKKILALVSIMAMTLVSLSVWSSTDLDDDAFNIYIGDVDGDGYDDLYLASIPNFVLLAMDITIPLTLYDTSSVLFKGDAYGSFENSIAWSNNVNVDSLTLADYTVHTGDFNGDGVLDLLLQSNGISYQNIVLSGSTGDTPFTAQIFVSLEGKVASSDYSTLTVQDVNGDGKDDVILDYGLSTQTVALTLATNRFNTIDYSDYSASAADNPFNVGADGSPENIVPGSTSGAFNVSKSSGSASYAIPVVVPVGTAGVQPNLTISYNSSAANGDMGVGFSVSGQSNIERCQKNRTLDGMAAVIDTESYETFCLDGNRLIAVDGIGREYRIAQDSFAKITSHGGTAVAPTYFIVLYKSGDMATYGNSSEARQQIKGVNSTWAITATQDRAGNSIAYHYLKKNNIIQTNYISYANNRIDFIYGPRADVISGYDHGQLQVINEKLNRIDISVGSSLFRSYIFNYDFNATTEHSRLTSVTECGAEGACLNPTKFTWSETPTSPIMGIDTDNANGNSIYNTGSCLNDSGCMSESSSFADLNGDGMLDLCYRDKSLGIVCRLNDGYGKFVADYSPLDNLCKKGFTSSLGNCNDSDNFSSITYQDFNLDGKADIVFRSDKGVRLYLNNGNGFTSATLNITDICGNDTKDSTTGTGCNSEDNYFTVKYTDVNGDKIPDICYRSDHGIACALSTGTISSSIPMYAAEVQLTSVCSNSHTDYKKCINGSANFMDFNGDGLGDLYYRSSSKGIVVYYSNGSGFSSSANIETYICDSTGGANSRTPECDSDNNLDQMSYPDLNGDGQTDICWRSDDGIKCYLGSGDDTSGTTLFTSLISTSICSNDDCDVGLVNFPGTAIQFADFNNDGKSDLFYRSKNGLRMHLFNGSGFSTEPDWSSSLCKLGANDTGCESKDNFTTISVVDVDGDNLPDLVYRDDDLGFRVIKNKMASATQSVNDIPVLADVVTKIETGMGISTEIEYTRFADIANTLGCNSVHCAPTYTAVPAAYPAMVINSLPMPLVKSVKSTASDGNLSGVIYQYDSFTAHANGYAGATFKTVREYKYPLRGSNSTSLVDFSAYTPSIYVEHEYNTVTERLFGRLNSTSSYIFTNDRILSNTTSTYESVNSHSADSRIQFVRLKNSIQTNYPKGEQGITDPYITNTDSYGYGSYGNVTSHIKSIALNDTTIKTVSTVSEYTDERPADWELGLLTKATVTTAAAGSASTTKASSWQYNSIGQVSVEAVEAGSSDEVNTSYTYNNFGLKASQTVAAAGMASVTSTYGYDVYGKYVTSAIMSNSSNDKRYSTSTGYDPLLGLQTSKTDANGLTSSTEYDGFSRAVQQTGPFGVVTAIKYDFSDDAYYTTTANNLGAASQSFYNKAGLVTETRGLSLTGQVVYKKYSFFADGGVRWEALPYFSGGTEYKTEVLTRDILNRPLTTSTPAGSIDVIAYDGFTTTYTNSLGQIKVIEKNVLGQTVRSQDHLGNEVRFTYDAGGKMVSTTDVTNGTSVTTVYDNMGRRTSINDPDKGVWSFTYNVFGNMLTQLNANGQYTCFAYDELGRMVKRIDKYTGGTANALSNCAGDTGSNRTSTWTYDTASKGSTGQLVQGALHTLIGPDGYQEEYTYDNYARVITAKRKIANVWYTESNSYDTYGRPLTHTYPSGLSTRNVYNSRGMLTSVEDSVTGYSYWLANNSDALGNITEEILGEHIIQSRAYNPQKGTIDSVVATSGQAGLVHSMNFEFNSLGNLTYRKDNMQGQYGLAETFTYDSLNRLTSNSFFNNGNRNSLATTLENYSYEANGNISNKSGVGRYDYLGTNGAGPHAVTRTYLNGIYTNYSYDANGNMTTDGDRTIVYTSFDKPLSIVRSGGGQVTFKYGPGRNRVERHDVEKSGKQIDTIYAAAGYELVTTAAFDGEAQKTQVKHYLPGGALIIEQTQNSVTTKVTRFMLSDHLGSTTTVVDEFGAIKQRFSYDPWGKRRNIDWSQIWDADLLAGLKGTDTNRGFTGHEMLDAVGVIHMNGRIYDPVLGRFMNADPVVQAPTNLQSLNRYSYVLNNPLTLTDPSGHVSLRQFGRWMDKNLIQDGGPIWDMYRGIIGEVMHQIKKNPEAASILGNVACGYATAGAGAVACAGMVGAVVTYGVTGDFEMAMTAGATAAATAAVWAGVHQGLDGGGAGASWQGFGDSVGAKIGKTMVHGTVGGLLSMAQGGKFGRGFAATAVSKGFYESGFGFDKNAGLLAHSFESAMLGGTASVFAGGSFANGAKSAAFARLFNDGLEGLGRGYMAQRIKNAWASIFYSKEYAMNMATESWNLGTGSLKEYKGVQKVAKSADKNAKGVVMTGLIESASGNKALGAVLQVGGQALKVAGKAFKPYVILDVATELPGMHFRSKEAALNTPTARIKMGSMPF